MSTNTGKCHEIVTDKSATSTRYIDINKPIEHLNNNNHKRQIRMTTRIYKRSQKTSLEAENENRPFRERSLD